MNVTNCTLCGRMANFDGATPFYDDLHRAWCESCVTGALALVFFKTSPALLVQIGKAKKLREAEKLERQAAAIREEVKSGGWKP